MPWENGVAGYAWTDMLLRMGLRMIAEQIDALRGWLRRLRGSSTAGEPDAPIVTLEEGETRLAVVHGTRVVADTGDITLSHAELVQRTVGTLPEGAWVGTLRKSGGVVMAINSRTFYGNQLPAPGPVLDAVRAAFR